MLTGGINVFWATGVLAHNSNPSIWAAEAGEFSED